MKKKNLISILLVVAMMFSIMPTAVWAENTTFVASVTFADVTTKYESIDDAWAAAIGCNTTANNKAIVTLLADCTAAATLTNTEDYIILNTDGKTLTTATNTASTYGIENQGGELELTGKGTIYSYRNTPGGTYIVKLAGGVLRLKDANIDASHGAIDNSGGTAYLHYGTLESSALYVVNNNSGTTKIVYDNNPLTLILDKGWGLFADISKVQFEAGSPSDMLAIIHYGADAANTTSIVSQTIPGEANESHYMKIQLAKVDAIPEITSHPADRDNYKVEINHDTITNEVTNVESDAEYQWYQVTTNETPLTDTDVNAGLYMDNYADGKWSPALTDEDIDLYGYIMLEMKAGDTLITAFDCPLPESCIIAVMNMDSYTPDDVSKSGNTYIFRAEEDGRYALLAQCDEVLPSAALTKVTVDEKVLDSQTNATLGTDGLEDGTYFCTVSWAVSQSGTSGYYTLTSNSVEYTAPEIYTITAISNPPEGGTTTGSGIYLDGATVTLTATANDGYAFVDWKNPDDNNNVVSTSSTYTFTATTNCTLVAYFELDQNSSGSNEGVNGGTTPQPDYGYSGGYYVPVESPKDEPKEPSKMDAVTACHGDASCPMGGYTDIDNDAWYHDGVHYCIENGIMGGYGNGIFRPNVAVSRAQISAMLWNMEGNPVVNYALDYKDVPADAWYTEAVRWMVSQNIAGGYGKGIYAPDDTLTREQLAAILQKYAQYKGYDMAANKEVDLQSYSDAASISDWAYASMQWICDSGIVGGMPGTNGDIILAPTGHATRAQVATMLMTFCEMEKE